MVTQKGILIMSKRVMEKSRVLDKEPILYSLVFVLPWSGMTRAGTAFTLTTYFFSKEKKERSAIK